MLRDETIARVVNFRDARNWRQFHTPKDLAISMSLEAAELLELFQWSGTDLECRDKLPQLREELADVLSYCTLLADVSGLDLDEIMNEKSESLITKGYGGSLPMFLTAFLQKEKLTKAEAEELKMLIDNYTEE